ncbi:hypothetical protein B484DRAFT_457244 [Ochromonadaceae sp. CCMP2298]|nr:hypothetical protein B484DRAFT_457244 [Ochromonadaceae sp. CCMP2298]
MGFIVISVNIIWVLLSYQYTYGFYCHISIHWVLCNPTPTPTRGLFINLCSVSEYFLNFFVFLPPGPPPLVRVESVPAPAPERPQTG